MPHKNADLHGNAPDKSDTALLLIDVINDFEFEQGDQLLRSALPMAHALVALKRRAQAANIPVVYVNDNFGRWQSDLNRQVEHCLHDGVRGRPIAELLRPNDNDYFVLKPKHSGFYCTTLDLLLRYLQVKRVVLTGVATNICVLFTAHDAYLRDLEVVVPADCSAANSEQEHQSALDHMARVLKTDVRPSKDFDFAALGR